MRKGFTLFETLIGSAALLVVSFGAMSLMAGAGRGYGRTSARNQVALNVSQSIQWMSQDLQQAKDVTLVSSSYVRIFFPVRNTDGTFIRSQLDSTNTVEYFRANTSLAASATGTLFVRRIGTGTPRVICRNVTNVSFVSDLAKSVTVSMTATGATGASFTMNTRAIFMRNN